jgi:serine/threonine protein kinase/formylglycine-generating enzyme required for sulfatase activity
MTTRRIILNRFEIEKLIGQGSMGEVYRGLDRETNKIVAIKALKQTSNRISENIERFTREGEALRRLDHPNIVKVLQSAVEQGSHYIVMEYVGGGSLDRLLRREQKLRIQRALEIAIELADALVRAHHVKIIHRDIKPQNVLLAEDSTPRLTDFGVAHMGDLSTITHSDTLIGTMPYLSPQAWKFDPPDEQTDIWAFGIMLYEMLAGRRPFDGDHPSALKQAILNNPVPDIHQFRPSVPPELELLIGHMLEKDPSQRILSMRQVSAALDNTLRNLKQSTSGPYLGATTQPLPEITRNFATALDLRIVKEQQGYSAQIRLPHSTQAEYSMPFQMPFDLTSLRQRRRQIADCVKQARIRRLSANQELQLAYGFGTELFRSLFQDHMLHLFRSSRARLPKGERLRLRLQVPPELELVPWELLRDPKEQQFLALMPDLTLQRAAQKLTPVQPLQLTGPLQVVVVLASPYSVDYPRIQLDRELRRIESALRTPIEQGQIELTVIRGPGTSDQLRARLRSPVHVLHVLCHGDLDDTRGSVLVFEDVDGGVELMNGGKLYTLIRRQMPHLVMLNACLGALPDDQDPLSSVGMRLLDGGVPAVIAMQFELAEDTAVELARAFYAELAAGMSVDNALAEARLYLASSDPNRLDWSIPVLLMCSDNSKLFVPLPAPQRSASTPKFASTPVVKHDPQRELQQLWNMALVAHVTRDWERALKLFQQVAAIQPNYEDVQKKLAETHYQLSLPPPYRQALAQRDDGNWQGALEALKELERSHPQFQDHEGVRAWAERHQRRDHRFQTARLAMLSHEWSVAVTALQEILADFPDDAEAAQLLTQAYAEWQAHPSQTRLLQREANRSSFSTRSPSKSSASPQQTVQAMIEQGQYALALDILATMLTHRQSRQHAAQLASTLIETRAVPLSLRMRAAEIATQVADFRPGVCELEPAWCSFPAGTYQIGSQRVTLDSFQISRYPITVRQFQRFWQDEQGYQSKQWWTSEGWAWKQETGINRPYRWGRTEVMVGHLPIIGVSWYEAMAFCNWLTYNRPSQGLLQRRPIVRLPTEAEWEVAAMWDAQQDQMRPWKPRPGEYWENNLHLQLDQPTPVGMFPEGMSPSGALDMAGNVWEWCSSRYSDYPAGSGRTQFDFSPNEIGPALRGGSFNTPSHQSGWQARTWYFASQHTQTSVGFRVVLVPRGLW